MAKKNFAEPYLKLKALSRTSKKEVEELASSNIFVADKDGHAICGSCNKRFKIHAKHKEECECPKCHKKMTVQHAWRMSQSIYEHAIMIVPQMVDKDCIVLRYICAERTPKREDYCGDKIRNTKWTTHEVARTYFHENYSYPIIYDMEYDWRTHEYKMQKGKHSYFRPDTYSCMCRNRHWVGYAYHPSNVEAIEAFKNLDCFKYYPLENIWKNHSHGVYQIFYHMRTARFNEKASKIGLQKLVDVNYNDWNSHNVYSYENTQCLFYGNKTIIDTLQITKPQLEIIKEAPINELKALCHLLAKHPEITKSDIEQCNYSTYNYIHLSAVVKTVNVTRTKMLNYIYKQKLHLTEYEHYLTLLEKMGYPLTDTYYSMPKDFRKADEKLIQEYEDKLATERAKSFLAKLKGQAEIDERIYQISKLIREAKELRFWTNGFQGLKVIVPQSVGELVDAGIHLHNCLSTYAEKIADKETLIFFIRRLNDPSEEYVAMEYKDGMRGQIRFDHNIEVEDSNILQFADAFVEQLNKLNINEKIRRIA